MTTDTQTICSLAMLDPIWARDLKATIIGGMAKTGTTLPLTLLDGHPDLVVFPEEFRFFHMKADRRGRGSRSVFGKSEHPSIVGG